MLKENVCQPRVLYIVKLSFKNERCKIGLHFILLHMVVQFSQHRLLKRLIHIILHKNSKPVALLAVASCFPTPVVAHDSSFIMESYLASVVVVQLPCCVSPFCDLRDCSPLGSSVHGISQGRIPEWVAISFSRESSQSRDRTQVSCISGRFFTI